MTCLFEGTSMYQTFSKHWLPSSSTVSLPRVLPWASPHLFFFFFHFYLWLCQVFIAVPGAFLSLGREVAALHCGAWSSHCGGFSCCGAQAVGRSALRSCSTQPRQLWLLGSRAQGQLLRYTGLAALRRVDLPRPGIKPMSPALGSRFLTTGPPGKSVYFEKRNPPQTCAPSHQFIHLTGTYQSFTLCQALLWVLRV